MKVDVLKKGQIDVIKSLLSIYELNDYRAYRMLDKDRLKEYLFNQVLDSSKRKNNWILVAEDKKEIVGLAVLNFLLWDTKHFGIKMAKISYLMARGNYNQVLAIKNRLLPYLLQLSKKEKIAHLSCRIDISDTSSIHALEANGFRLMDTLVTYAFNRCKHNIPNVKELYKIREFKKEDLDILVNLATRAFTIDRFHLDPFIPNDKADVLYGEWIKNCCKNKIQGKVLIAENDRRCPVGFLTYKLNKELNELTGVRIIGHGLSVVSPQAKGAYVALVKATVKNTIQFYDCAEFDTQLNNYEVIKIWERFKFDFIRAKYTFHKWLRKRENNVNKTMRKY